MKRIVAQLGPRARWALIAAIGAIGLVLSPDPVQANQQALYSDGQGGGYCDDTCSGKGCCPDRIAVVVDG